VKLFVAGTRSWMEGHDKHVRHMILLHKKHLTTAIIEQASGW